MQLNGKYVDIKIPSKIRFNKINKKDINLLSNHQCVYLLFKNKRLIYVGKTNSLKTRLRYHKNRSTDFDYAYWLDIPQKWELTIIENFFIYYFKPKFNYEIDKEENDVLEVTELDLENINLS